MTKFQFPAPPPATLPVRDSDRAYAVTRIFCVGRNYADHAAEFGNQVDRDAPFYFTKTTAHLTGSGATIPYPPGTANYHHEMEFVVALGAPAFRVSEDAAWDAVFGYAAGLDMTRRDLQAKAKEARKPWDYSKDFEHGAVIGAITPATAFGRPGPQAISLLLNGEPVQRAHLSDMVWSVPAIIAHLSTLYHLGPGDLIMTGTPAGVGAVRPGDALFGEVDGLAPVELTVGPAE
ncbi:MAG: fumarylacetoacetate hydrolase family protein [Rhodobacteraceae bacterium]|nr:fumarylacetoacetate hydrolase family protein [Paracoccaceae bacterium]